jgi:hypothetical protein
MSELEKTRMGIIGLTCLPLLLSACGGGGYGYAKYYVPTRAEKPFDETSMEYTHGVVAVKPEDFNGKLIAWFGVVKDIEPMKDGRHRVHLSFHKHRERHLCETEMENSCRVTINQRSTGDFTAILKIDPEDLIPGLDKIQPGTLMRVFGKVRCRQVNSEYELDKWECDKDKHGGVLLIGEFYRQWPRREYRTTHTSNKMVR